jgi:hypothetical protein
MGYSTTNYKEQGGERWIIGGRLEMSDGTHLFIGETNLEDLFNEKLTATKAAFQEESIATTVAGLKDDLNTLIDKLIAAGLMESE